MICRESNVTSFHWQMVAPSAPILASVQHFRDSSPDSGLWQRNTTLVALHFLSEMAMNEWRANQELDQELVDWASAGADAMELIDDLLSR